MSGYRPTIFIDRQTGSMISSQNSKVISSKRRSALNSSDKGQNTRLRRLKAKKMTEAKEASLRRPNHVNSKRLPQNRTDNKTFTSEQLENERKLLSQVGLHSPQPKEEFRYVEKNNTMEKLESRGVLGGPKERRYGPSFGKESLQAGYMEQQIYGRRHSSKSRSPLRRGIEAKRGSVQLQNNIKAKGVSWSKFGKQKKSKLQKIENSTNSKRSTKSKNETKSKKPRKLLRPEDHYIQGDFGHSNNQMSSQRNKTKASKPHRNDMILANNIDSFFNEAGVIGEIEDFNADEFNMPNHIGDETLQFSNAPNIDFVFKKQGGNIPRNMSPFDIDRHEPILVEEERAKESFGNKRGYQEVTEVVGQGRVGGLDRSGSYTESEMFRVENKIGRGQSQGNV